MPVTTQNTEYANNTRRWRQVRDCVEGDERIKARGTRYLPQFIPTDAARYDQYRERAIFVNFTGRTLSSLVGAAFRKPPEATEIPDGLLPFLDDLDGRGQSLAQVAKSTISNGLQTGRHGLLVDYPRTEGTLTIEQVAAQGIRPTVREYTAENIINWRMQGDKTVLVVLRETVEDTSDFFNLTTDFQYRVLRLIGDVYVQQLYDDGGTQVGEDVIPADSTGAAWDIIPFVFYGATNNTPDVDQPPLYDMSVVNIGHYRNSADYEEALHFHGQVTPHVDTGDMSAEDFQKLNPKGIKFGARAGIVTNGGGTATLLQVTEGIASSTGMDKKESQLIQIGARLVQRGGQNETAEAVRVNASSENSVLGNLVENAQAAFTQCLEWMGRYAGITGEIQLVFNTDFFDREPDPQVIAQFLGLRASGDISSEEVRAYLRRTNALADEMTDEEALDSADGDGP